MESKKKLILALCRAKAPERMIKRAAQSYYHDYDSPLSCPISQLIKDCINHKLDRVAIRAIDGDFDATPEEAKEWQEREGVKFLRQGVF